METGVHERVPSEQYHRWPAAGVHVLMELRRSPAHAKQKLDFPSEPTPAMQFGTAFHDLIGLGDAGFCQMYAEGIVADGRTKDGKAAKAAHAEANVGKTILDPRDWSQLFMMRDAARCHAHAARLLKAVEGVEVSAVWEDPILGIRCKSRSDLLVPKYRTIIDIKTTADASPTAFEKSVLNYGYHLQAAHYLDGWKALGKDYAAFAFLAVEKEPPYGVALYTLADEAIEAGRRELRSLLSQWKHCITLNDWPGYPTGVQEISLPPWALRRLESMGLE